jgi:archaellum component FlaC
LNHLLERGLFKPEQGEGQMWGQRNSKYATAIGTQLLVKIHVLDNKIGHVDCQQNHPTDCLEEHVNFIGDVLDRIGRVVDELNSHIDAQEVQIEQLANMVNDLVRKTEKQAKEIKVLKDNQEEHCKVIDTLTAKVIALEQCVEDVQRKACPQVGGTLPNYCLFVDASSSL